MTPDGPIDFSKAQNALRGTLAAGVNVKVDEVDGSKSADLETGRLLVPTSSPRPPKRAVAGNNPASGLSTCRYRFSVAVVHAVEIAEERADENGGTPFLVDGCTQAHVSGRREKQRVDDGLTPWLGVGESHEHFWPDGAATPRRQMGDGRWQMGDGGWRMRKGGPRRESRHEEWLTARGRRQSSVSRREDRVLGEARRQTGSSGRADRGRLRLVRGEGVRTGLLMKLEEEEEEE
ncbi:hypothetical protein K490DRAFT_56938 [Saccharata proteae CBS 121410]|uniref:Uncharacterized protein n=1 Tax=Saccharata proteae CBS 121410 TaxID=1314787 RepID=A0A9P4HV06_9PEZI|nr:hypothetical protein K490DRAFT_56938 [Saccharata proteae CBS 121410]